MFWCTRQYQRTVKRKFEPTESTPIHSNNDRSNEIKIHPIETSIKKSRKTNLLQR